jgi:hypothetical protein
MSTNGMAESQSYGGASFAPMTYDDTTIEPNAYPGEYEAEIVEAKWGINSKNRPMITLTWKLNSSPDEGDCQKSVGDTLRDWISFSNDKSGNPGKLASRTLKERFGIDLDTSSLTPEILTEYCGLLRGNTMTIFVVATTNRDGQPDVGVKYNAPRTAGMAPMNAEPEEEIEPAPKATAKKPAAKATPAKVAVKGKR